MVGQIQKGFDETFEEGGKVDVVDERSVGKMKIIVMNDGKSSRTITFLPLFEFNAASNAFTPSTIFPTPSTFIPVFNHNSNFI